MTISNLTGNDYSVTKALLFIIIQHIFFYSHISKSLMSTTLMQHNNYVRMI